MTKMASAKMDVVRFDESDVICGSSPVNFMTVSGMGNDDQNDGTITYKGTDYSINNLSGFYTQFNHSNHTNIDDDSSIYIWPDEYLQSATTLGQLPTWETGSGDTDKVNGAYVWRDSAFHHQ